VTTPQRLEVRRDPEHLWSAVVDENGGDVGDVQWHPTAAEIARRYNLHDDLVKALEAVETFYAPSAHAVETGALPAEIKGIVSAAIEAALAPFEEKAE
jgi:hypothetical protein